MRPLNIPLLRRIACHILEQELGVNEYELGIHLVDAPEMTRVNQQFLQHEGSTDVITFDHGSSECRLHGEVFISVFDAMKQSRAFRTTWQSEIVRYVIHGFLHLCGCDDVQPAKRREMKLEENRLLKQIDTRFAIKQLARTRKFDTRKPS